MQLPTDLNGKQELGPQHFISIDAFLVKLELFPVLGAEMSIRAIRSILQDLCQKNQAIHIIKTKERWEEIQIKIISKMLNIYLCCMFRWFRKKN